MAVKDFSAVVVAAGRGQRLGRGNKSLLSLAGEPLLAHTLRALRQADSVAELVLVMNPEDLEALDQQWDQSPQDLGADHVVAGGKERWQSSLQGCAATNPDHPYVLVQDAARPLTWPSLLEEVAAAVRQHGAAIAAKPLTDSLKQEGEKGWIGESLERQHLWRAQTPQGARRDRLLAAFEHWPADAPSPTDEASLLLAAGHKVALVLATSPNFKVTHEADLELAAAVLQSRTTPLS